MANLMGAIKSLTEIKEKFLKMEDYSNDWKNKNEFKEFISEFSQLIKAVEFYSLSLDEDIDIQIEKAKDIIEKYHKEEECFRYNDSELKKMKNNFEELDKKNKNIENEMEILLSNIEKNKQEIENKNMEIEKYNDLLDELLKKIREISKTKEEIKNECELYEKYLEVNLKISESEKEILDVRIRKNENEKIISYFEDISDELGITNSEVKKEIEKLLNSQELIIKSYLENKEKKFEDIIEKIKK